MKSYTTLRNLVGSLSLNASATNLTLMDQLINDEHRYLLLKYFDNEKSTTLTTVGTSTATIATSLATGATSATLNTAWGNLTAQQLVVFPNGEQRTVLFTNNATGVTWTSGLSSASGGTTISELGVQSYLLPADVSKIKNDTITVGQLVYTPAPVQSIQEWTKLNALPYNSEIPAYFYIYGGYLNFWPIPSATGDLITLNYQRKFPDLNIADTTGILATSGMSVGSYAAVGSGTTWTSSYPTGTDISFLNLYMKANPPQGDGMWYPIQSVTDDTHLTLKKPVVNAPKIAGASFTIGQFPLVTDEFQDILVYRVLRTYFNSIVKDPDKFQVYDKLVNEKQQLMEYYLASKSVNVDLSVTPVLTNPNLYTFAPPQ